MSTRAIADAMDPGTGDLLFDASGSRPAHGFPTVERIIRRLRTPRGQCPLDPTYGVDMSFANKAYPDILARWTAAVREALAPEVSSGAIDELVIDADVDGSSLTYSVSFVDVRERARRTVSNLRAG